MENKLKEYRQKENISLRELARISQVSVSTISEIEAGKHIPRIDTALMIATALGCKVEELFFLER